MKPFEPGPVERAALGVIEFVLLLAIWAIVIAIVIALYPTPA